MLHTWVCLLGKPCTKKNLREIDASCLSNEHTLGITREKEYILLKYNKYRDDIAKNLLDLLAILHATVE